MEILPDFLARCTVVGVEMFAPKVTLPRLTSTSAITSGIMMLDHLTNWDLWDQGSFRVKVWSSEG